MDFQGLSDEDVRISREQNGSNALTEQKKETFFQKLIGNFDDPIIKILCVALLLNVVFAFLGQVAWYESVGIALAVVLATGVSTLSEYKNESAFQKLQAEASQIQVKVYRNGKLVPVPQDDIVKGDTILLQTGDKVPADGVLIHGTIAVDQSVLNGEAKECEKTATHPGNTEAAESRDFLQPHKAFRGSVVLSGNAVLLVTSVGDATIYGGIAGELQEDNERDTPLKLKLRKLAGDISKFGYIGGVAIALAFMADHALIANHFDPVRISAYFGNGLAVFSDLVDAVILAVIIIVMAVPEGLPLMIAIVSAQNMRKMLSANVLVRKINGIETAGSLNLLFSDKTGTITKGKLEAVTFVHPNGAESPKFTDLPDAVQETLALSILANSSAVVTDGVAVGGNMTERALIGFLPNGKKAHYQKLAETPFTSQNKYSMATVEANGKELTLVKGAPEKILFHCNPESFDAEAVENQLNTLARRAIRVLAFAVKEGKVNGDELPSNMQFLGAIGIRDEVRPESKTAIAELHRAGVQIVMITGDRADTATAIAQEAGLLDSPEALVLTSEELSQMSDETVKHKLNDLRVVARALPSDKSRLVRLAQELNLVVGMTGDGVNDSPALKAADVGFAMGSGTEVAKEASEIVILDDNFHSLENAVLYGRTIYHSIRKFIVFQLTINVGAVMICFASPLLGIDTPLSITQILWINLIMDTLAALAFGGEPALKRYLRERPKRRDENIISRDMASAIGVAAFWCFFLSMVFLLSDFAASHFRYDANNKYLLTGYFAFFVFMAVFNAFNARTDKRNLFDHIKENPGFLYVMGGISIVQVVLTYFGGVIMRCYGLTVCEWGFVLLLAFSIIPVDLVRKTVMKRK